MPLDDCVEAMRQTCVEMNYNGRRRASFASLGIFQSVEMPVIDLGSEKICIGWNGGFQERLATL